MVAMVLFCCHGDAGIFVSVVTVHFLCQCSCLLVVPPHLLFTNTLTTPFTDGLLSTCAAFVRETLVSRSDRRRIKDSQRTSSCLLTLCAQAPLICSHYVLPIDLTHHLLMVGEIGFSV